MLLFSVFNSSVFGIFSDSALHRFEKGGSLELQEIQNQIVDLMLDEPDRIFSIQSICRAAQREYSCEVGRFYSPIVIMNVIKQLAKEHRKQQ